MNSQGSEFSPRGADSGPEKGGGKEPVGEFSVHTQKVPRHAGF